MKRIPVTHWCTSSKLHGVTWLKTIIFSHYHKNLKIHQYLSFHYIILQDVPNIENNSTKHVHILSHQWRITSTGPGWHTYNSITFQKEIKTYCLTVIVSQCLSLHVHSNVSKKWHTCTSIHTKLLPAIILFKAINMFWIIYNVQVWVRRVQPTGCNVSQFIYFCKTLYMFQAVFPPIIRSSKLDIQCQTNTATCC